MLSIPLGPVAMPLAPLLLMLAAAAAARVANHLSGRAPGGDPDREAGEQVMGAALMALLAARVAHVAVHFDAYLLTPLDMLDIRDGGWSAWAGACAGAAWLAFRAYRAPALAWSLAGGGAAGAAIWVAASLVLLRPADPAVPDLLLQELAGGARVPLRPPGDARPMVVNLWASWCGPCREEMPTLARAQAANPAVRFVFVNQGESADKVRGWLAHERLPLGEVLMDPQSRMSRAVGSSGLPATVFYDGHGRRVDAHFGVISAAALAAKVRALTPRH